MPSPTRLLLALVFAICSAHAALPLDYYLPAGTAYDPKVPTPAQYFGYQVGEWHLTSEQVTGYLRAVAQAAPERVKFDLAGRSHEQKPLVFLVITAPENHRNLERIRTDHLALLDPAAPAPAQPDRRPVIVNLGYTVHGNEPSGMNAVPLVVYHLAAAQDEKTMEQLRHAVILVEPLRNPDGADRAASWFNQHRSLAAPSADPSDREHLEAWPRGRFNHYWFDPNRDWLPLVHPEARVQAEHFHRWRPHVLTDHHEMGTNYTYFFQPGVPTRNNPSTAPRVIELTRQLAAFHQRALDGVGSLYYTEQNYDDFFPGKGSTYPDLHGTVGILFEQGSARGHAQESDNGRLTFPFAIRNQVLTSFSTLAGAVALRGEFLAHQQEHTRATREAAARSKVKAYVFGDDGDPARAWAFRDLLALHRVEVRTLAAPVAAAGHEFRRGAAWVVPVEQAQYRLITEIFTRRTKFEDNVFYDISAWTLPLAYNLPYAELEAVPATEKPQVGRPGFPAGRLVGGPEAYAYIFGWDGYFAPRALHRLQQAGIAAKGLTGAPIEVEATDGTRATLAPGAVLVPVGLQPGQRARIREVIDTIVKQDALTVYSCATGLTPRGVDFGSGSFVPLATPRVALVVGQGVVPQAIGAAWHVLDQRVGLTPTLLDVAQFGAAELGRYQVIVMADGTYDETVDDATLAALKRWVREGGTLVAMGRAIQWVARKEVAALELGAAPAASAAGSGSERTAKAAPVRLPYGSAADQEAMKRVAGALFATSVDTTHPLGFGFNGERLTLCRANTIVLKPAKSPYHTPVVYTEKPLLGGFASEANQQSVANTAAVVALPVGRGAVVAMPDDPNFRGFWYGGNRLFFNAVFYGRAIVPIRDPSE